MLISEYNLTYLENKIKLIFHKRSLIYLEKDKFVMEFEVDKSIVACFELKSLNTK